jgi:hypothetical protein
MIKSKTTERAPASRPAWRSERAVFAAFVVGAIALANVAAARFHRRVDLTEDHVFTLSPASRALVASLPDYLTVKAFVSKDLPVELAQRGRFVLDLLEEYRAAAGGKLRVDVVDGNDDKVEAQATRCGISRTAFEARRGQKVEAGRAYLGLCFFYGGKSRALATVAAPAELEYQLSALVKRISEPPRKIAFSTGHGEKDLGDSFSFVKLALDQEHEVVTLDPSVAAIGDDVDVLVVAGPRRPFDERGRSSIARFLSGASGKGAIFLVDGMTPDPADGGEGRLAGAPVATGLEPLLARYGFAIGHDLVFDRQNAPGPVGGGATPGLVANRPAFVEVTRTADGAAAPPDLVAGIPAMVFPFASSVRVVEPPGGEADGAAPATRRWALATTSAAAWRRGDGVAPDGNPGPVALAYAAEAARAAAGGGAAPLRLLVVGDADFAADANLQLARSFPIYAGGPEMLLRAVDWMLADQTLASLRGNTHRARPLSVDAEARATAYTWGNAVGVPMAFCAAGLLRWRLRRARRLAPRGTRA